MSLKSSGEGDDVLGMGGRTAPWWAKLVAAVVVASALPLAPAYADPGAVSAAQQSRAAAQERADLIGARLAELRARLATATADLDRAQAETATAVSAGVSADHAASAARSAAAAATDRWTRRIRALYMSGGTTAIYASLLDAGSLTDLSERAVVVGAVLRRDSDFSALALQARRTAETKDGAAAQVAATSIAYQRTLTARSEDVTNLLSEQQRLLDDADASVRALLAAEQAAVQTERERQVADQLARARAAAALPAGASPTEGAASGPAGPAGADGGSPPPPGPRPPPPGSSYTCPVGPVHSFTDTFGAPRPGGRTHQGTDVFAPYGAPEYAVADGIVVKAGTNPLGGFAYTIRSDVGDTYYYAHQSQNLVTTGQRVRVGDVTGLVGTSGDAVGTPPHVHFELHPGGGTAVDSYSFLRGVCG